MGTTDMFYSTDRMGVSRTPSIIQVCHQQLHQPLCGGPVACGLGRRVLGRSGYWAGLCQEHIQQSVVVVVDQADAATDDLWQIALFR